MHAEWTKLRTAPATARLPLAIAALTIGLTLAVTALAEPGTTACAGGCDTTALVLSGVHLGHAPAVALAVLVIAGEYDSGLIATTLTATPRRLTVLVAKAAAVAAAVLPGALVGVAGALLAGHSHGYGVPLRAAATAVPHLVLAALLSLGAATALRHTAPALTTVLGLLYLPPILAQFVADAAWRARIDAYAPMTAGLGVLAAEAAVALAVGAAFLLTRSATP
ncbi:ABC transporter permease [Phytohabitans rumicis]|uniref:ABC transporter permease n=1 Tax=Phytohabitans rumicis TaxID=1076125 RepID=A0A6V8LGH5_9ACTN|nr:ABC transporter permease [Phytohabitans rumicis]GFJ96343.1 hypothetical protein Prum_099850 [Phytohabitans rumicis]